MPGILKVGMTERNPEARLKEANSSDTWRPPTPYVIEFAKKVSNVKDKEKTLHIHLEKYNYRIHPQREFFRVSLEIVRKLFDRFEGEMWVEHHHDEDNEDHVDDEDEEEPEYDTPMVFDKHAPRALRELSDYLRMPRKKI